MGSSRSAWRVLCTIGVALTPVAACTTEAAGQETVVRLTETGARNGQAFFSPDGAWISFVSNRSGSWQVWLMPAAGGAARQLTDSPDPAGWPGWSRAGDAILYYVQTEAGHRLRRIDVAGGVPVPLYDDGVDDFRPILSPDGRRLLFDRYGATTRRNHDLFVRDLARQAVTQLTDDPGYDSDARWSPDGTRIVFHSDRDGAARHALQVYVIEADGSSVRRLTDGPAVHAYPAWSPDGRHIAYTSELDGNRDVWIMRADGSMQRRVTRHPGFDGDPVWAPDGRHILFSTDRFGGQELVRIDVSGLLPGRE